MHEMLCYGSRRAPMHPLSFPLQRYHKKHHLTFSRALRSLHKGMAGKDFNSPDFHHQIEMLFWCSCGSSVNDKPALFFFRAFVNALLVTLHEGYPLCSAPCWVMAGSGKEITPAPSPWRGMPPCISCCSPLTHASLLLCSICLCNSRLASYSAWHGLCQQLQVFRCGYLLV